MRFNLYETAFVTSINDLNMAALDQYFTPYEFEFSKESEAERKQLLINTDILAISGEATVGGLLMFGINPSRYLPQASIMFAHFDGIEDSAELFNRQEIIGTLPYQVDTAVAILKNHLVRPSTIEGMKRVATREYFIVGSPANNLLSAGPIDLLNN